MFGLGISAIVFSLCFNSCVGDITKHKNWHLLDFGTSCGQRSWLQGADKLNGNIGPRILGGKDAVTNEFPWIVQFKSLVLQTVIEKLGVAKCGGSIINNRYVLTAAHCCTHRAGERIFNQVVRLSGDSNTESDDAKNDLEFTVESVRIHKNYSSENMQNDICLVRLTEPIKFSEKTHPVCLPSDKVWLNKNLTGTNVTIAGWGAVIEADNSLKPNFPTRLQKAEVPIVDPEVCVREWAETGQEEPPVDPRTQLCTGSSSTKDACVGDSGGPAVYRSSADIQGPRRYFLLGLVSFGDHCTKTKSTLPGVFVRVSSYIQWILDNIEE